MHKEEIVFIAILTCIFHCQFVSKLRIWICQSYSHYSKSDCNKFGCVTIVRLLHIETRMDSDRLR